MFLGCSLSKIRLEDASHSSNDGTHKDCIFCHATAQNGFDIVLEVSSSHMLDSVPQYLTALAEPKDETYTVFRDHKPAAIQHLLVIPKRHIGEDDDLTFMIGIDSRAQNCRAKIAFNLLQRTM